MLLLINTNQNEETIDLKLNLNLFHNLEYTICIKFKIHSFKFNLYGSKSLNEIFDKNVITILHLDNIY